MFRPVCVLEMPHCPLLPCEKVLHLQTCGGIAARVRAEASCDLKPSVGDSVVPGTKPWPVPKALLPTSLLFRCHHCYNCNSLFPHHLPKVLAGIL